MLGGVSHRFALGAWVGVPFLLLLIGYGLLSLGYSLVLKQIVVLDVLVLASLYTLRIFAGGCG
jgi:4-hydroxybenzoate polyprenyltransferase